MGAKKITILRGDKHIELPIMFDIFDARNTSLMAENQVIGEARNSREALSQYLKDRGEDVKFIRGGSREVTFCVSPFFVDEGRRYRAGKRIWYKII